MNVVDLVVGGRYLYSERTADGYPVDSFNPVLINKIEDRAVYLSNGKILKPAAGKVKQLSVLPNG